MLSVFFSGVFPGDCPPSLFGFFRVPPVLGILFGGFFGTNFGLGVRSFWDGFLGLKMPLFASQKRLRQSSPFLRFFPEFYFCYGVFFAEGFGQ